MPTYVGPAGVTDSWVTQTALFASTTSDRDARHGDRQAAGLRGRAARRCVLPAGAGPAAQRHRRLVRRDRCRRRLRLPRAGARPLPDRRLAVRARASCRSCRRSSSCRPEEHATVDGTLRRGARIRGVVTSHGNPVAGPRRAGQPRRRDAGRRHDRRGRAGIASTVWRPGPTRSPTTPRGRPTGAARSRLWSSRRTRWSTLRLTVHRGASITIAFRKDGAPAIKARDELRDSDGRAVLGQLNQNGMATYTRSRAGHLHGRRRDGIGVREEEDHGRRGEAV